MPDPPGAPRIAEEDRSHGDAGDVDPGGESLGATEPEVRGRVVVSAAGENVGDLVMSRKGSVEPAVEPGDERQGTRR
jgi:hypothetical protein